MCYFCIMANVIHATYIYTVYPLSSPTIVDFLNLDVVFLAAKSCWTTLVYRHFLYCLKAAERTDWRWWTQYMTIVTVELCGLAVHQAARSAAPTAEQNPKSPGHWVAYCVCSKRKMWLSLAGSEGKYIIDCDLAVDTRRKNQLAENNWLGLQFATHAV